MAGTWEILNKYYLVVVISHETSVGSKTIRPGGRNSLKIFSHSVLLLGPNTTWFVVFSE